jgi:hypothetical protein
VSIDAASTKGAVVRKAISLLFGRAGSTDRLTVSDWWAYFGSFGDDIFCDEVPEQVV